MNVSYINLKSEVSRRKDLELSFSKNSPASWKLVRIEAYTPEMILQAGMEGSITLAEKACFISHKKAIQENMNSSRNFMIVEDDTLFGKNTTAIIESAINSIPDNETWDIIFTDVGIFDVGIAARLAVRYLELKRRNAFQLLDLKDMPFFGANAYVISRHSAKRIYSMLENESVLNEHYDHYLRQKIDDGSIRAMIIFPYATTLSAWSENSSIQAKEKSCRDIVWNSFRQLSWADAVLVDVGNTDPPKNPRSDLFSSYGVLLGDLIKLSVNYPDDHKPIKGTAYLRSIKEINRNTK